MLGSALPGLILPVSPYSRSAAELAVSSSPITEFLQVLWLHDRKDLHLVNTFFLSHRVLRALHALTRIILRLCPCRGSYYSFLHCKHVVLWWAYWAQYIFAQSWEAQEYHTADVACLCLKSGTGPGGCYLPSAHCLMPLEATGGRWLFAQAFQTHRPLTMGLDYRATPRASPLSFLPPHPPAQEPSPPSLPLCCFLCLPLLSSLVLAFCKNMGRKQLTRNYRKIRHGGRAME